MFYLFKNFTAYYIFFGIADSKNNSKYNCHCSLTASDFGYCVYIYFCQKIPYAKYGQQYSQEKKILSENGFQKNIWKRIYKNLPKSFYQMILKTAIKGISDADKLLEEQGIIFARGINAAKLIWVLFYILTYRRYRRNHICAYCRP